MIGALLRHAIRAAAVAGGAAAATAGARYMGSRRIVASEKLGRALMDTQRIEEALPYTIDESEAALAACAVYLINVAYEAASGISGPPTLDPIGHERAISSDSSGTTATITTTAHEPETRWQFDVVIPGLARISGSRRLEASRFSGSHIKMKTPDTVTIRYDNGYSARIESDLEFASNLLRLVGPQTQLIGNVNLSDNRGNVGLLRIDAAGVVTGTITRGPNIVGRFDGNLTSGLTFRSNSPVAA